MKTLLLILVFASAAFGQPTMPSPQSVTSPEVLNVSESILLTRISLIRLSIDSCKYSGATPVCKQYPSEMATLYAEASKSPKVIRALAVESVMKYRSMLNQGGDKSAMQVSQIADQQNAELLPLLVLQNQRIIELLEQIAKKPK